MALSFITWNINKCIFTEISGYLDAMIESHNPDVLTFLEAEHLGDAEIESRGYIKIALQRINTSLSIKRQFCLN